MTSKRKHRAPFVVAGGNPWMLMILIILNHFGDLWWWFSGVWVGYELLVYGGPGISTCTTASAVGPSIPRLASMFRWMAGGVDGRSWIGRGWRFTLPLPPIINWSWKWVPPNLVYFAIGSSGKSTILIVFARQDVLQPTMLVNTKGIFLLSWIIF